LNDLERGSISWVGLLGLLNFSMKPFTNLFSNSSAINRGGRHDEWSTGEQSIMGNKMG
jgi:hypothetical protein